MIRARIIAPSGLLVAGLFAAACHKHARVQSSGDVAQVIKDTTVVVAPVIDKSVIAFFKDTASASAFNAEGEIFKPQIPGQRVSLHATVRKERALWQARKPSDYRFLLRVGCFCPGTRGWLLMEVRSGKLVRAWDTYGRSVPLTDWNTVSIDGLYDNLQRGLDNNGEVQIAFDPRWHFPKYFRTSGLQMPDSWSITEARALRPM